MNTTEGEHLGMRDDDFASLVTPHLTAMLRVARVMVGADAAEDVAQEAVTSAWRRRADLRDSNVVRTWLLRITVNSCHNWRRARNNPAGRYALSLAEELLPEGLYPSDPGASDHAIRLDLRQAISGLEPEHQQLIALRYFAGLDSAEIGAMLGASPATVRTRLRRALTLLRQRLNGPDCDLAAPAREKGNVDV
ncbi:MAG TPA: sigma-70 family RNA polymerase sigma factor [Ktedonobacterales bacterium]|nr:sigma-70 family RNA polymerase sigma factor [Ktedonobacterales bacterium]